MLDSANSTYYATLAQVIPVLLLAGVIELRVLDPDSDEVRSRRRERLVQMYAAGGSDQRRARIWIVTNGTIGSFIVHVALPCLALVGELAAVLATLDSATPNLTTAVLATGGLVLAMAYLVMPVVDRALLTVQSSREDANIVRGEWALIQKRDSTVDDDTPPH